MNKTYVISFLGEYAFDASPEIFPKISSYYRNGHLHKPTSMCMMEFIQELEYWNIRPKNLDLCCWHSKEAPAIPTSGINSVHPGRVRFETGGMTSVHPNKTGTTLLATQTLEPDSAESDECMLRVPVDEPDMVPLNRRKPTVVNLIPTKRFLCWNLTDDSTNSRKAMIMAWIMITFVFLSILEIVLSSMKFFQKDDGSPHLALVVLEFVCVVWFTVEFVIGLLTASSIKEFAFDLMNVIDFITIFPFYLEKLLLFAAMEIKQLQDIQALSMTVRVLRIIRILRVFKMARYNRRMMLFLRSLADSGKEMLMILLYLVIVVFIFSATIYYSEKDSENTAFAGMKHTRIKKLLR
ncbi:MAG: potassium voltage-gated channel protein [Gammaproteobacteria bacterium]|nr:potassium voltage-gated channel protein [Gammaproteobacteria bacterium]